MKKRGFFCKTGSCAWSIDKWELDKDVDGCIELEINGHVLLIDESDWGNLKALADAIYEAVNE